jgi:hypothetical protein
MDFAPSWQNNSREIAKSYEEAFTRCPCDYHAQKLESIGYTVDFLSTDWGNDFEEPLLGNDEVINLTQEEEAEVWDKIEGAGLI